jgi:CheY-like chemotaxis protein
MGSSPPPARLRSSFFGRGVLQSKTILIIEDEPLIALDLYGALRAAGADVIAATHTLEALQLIRRNDMSAAVVDVNLGNENCLAVCQALYHRAIPFLFYTGQRGTDVLKAWPETPVFLKPTPSEAIVDCLGQLTK